MSENLEPVYTLALDTKIVNKALQKLGIDSDMTLRELIDFLLKEWVDKP